MKRVALWRSLRYGALGLVCAAGFFERQLRLEGEPGMTYYVTVSYGPPIGYQVHAFAGIPNMALLEQFNR